MYRDNEASRVGDVLACKLANDSPGLVAAATRLWLMPAEHASGRDEAADEVWHAIEAADAIAAAVAAGVRLVRDRQLIRPSVFIAIIEHVEDPALLVELATIVATTSWPVSPYLATIFLWLIELKQEDALWRHIQAHRERLRADTPSWTLVGFVLTTSRIGDRYDLAAWFKEWDQRRDVPMWIVAAYLASLSHLPDQFTIMTRHASAAWEKTIHDTTAPFILPFALSDHLRNGRDAAYLELMRVPAESLPAPIDNPIVRYANAAKHRSPVSREDFQFTLAQLDSSATRVGLIALAAQGAPVRPVNWRIVILIHELAPWIARSSRILPMFAKMLPLAKGDPEALKLYREMQKLRPASFPGVVEAWQRMVKTRTTWFERFKAAFS